MLNHRKIREIRAVLIAGCEKRRVVESDLQPCLHHFIAFNNNVDNLLAELELLAGSSDDIDYLGSVFEVFEHRQNRNDFF